MQQQDEHIRRQLQQLEELPLGIRFNAAFVWDKIEADLKAAPAKPRIRWYLVAASFILVTITLAIIYQPNKQQPRSTFYYKKDNQQPLTPQQKPTQETGQSNTITVIKKNKQQQQVNTLQETPVTVPDAEPPGNIVAIATTDQINEPVIVDTAIETISVEKTAATVKPRLKIIHINELYIPEPPVIAVRDDKPKHTEEAESTEPVFTPSLKLFWKTKPRKTNIITITEN
jgi:hypothetical protein